MKRLAHKQDGFTLIELLVVITIIGILATLAPSAINGALNNAKQAKALNGARNIGMAIKLYAADHDGSLPKASGSALDAFNLLLPEDASSSGYIKDKKAFFVKGSQWSTKEPSGTSPKLVSGENHWGYFSGLSSESPENWPMVVDGFKSEGVYSAKKTEQGGLWEGRSAIVVRVNGSAAKEPLTDLKLVSDGQENALKISDNWLTGATYASPN